MIFQLNQSTKLNKSMTKKKIIMNTTISKEWYIIISKKYLKNISISTYVLINKLI
jgi:hypothetical protein